MRKILFCLLTQMVLIVISCHRSPDDDVIRTEILELHRSFIQAHLHKDAAFIARPTSPEHIFVSNGVVENIDAVKMEKRLSDYLNTTEFTDYSDIAEPIIGMSRDGSLAWAVVQVRTAGTRKISDGASRDFDVQWAWITLYQKIGNQWLRIVEVSTDRPFVENTH